MRIIIIFLVFLSQISMTAKGIESVEIFIDENCKIFSTVACPDSTFIASSTCDPQIHNTTDTLFLTNSIGCDSVVFNTYTILNASDTTILPTPTCDPSLLNDTIHLFNSLGCDSVLINNYYLINPDTTFILTNTCDPNLSIDTVYYPGSFECDSIVIYNYSLIETDITNQVEEVCFFSNLDPDTLIFTNQSGCDSLVVTNYLFISPDTTFITAPTCNPNSGIDTILYVSSTGCDSLAIYDYYFTESDTVYLIEENCDFLNLGPDTVTFNQQPDCEITVITNYTLTGNGNTYYISGNVFQDFNQDCQYENGETGWNDVIIKAVSEENIYYSLTDSNGNYLIETTGEAMQLSIVFPSSYWETCENPIFVDQQVLCDTTRVDFPLSPNIICPNLTVDIGTPFLRWCRENYYIINYCNDGTATAENAFVEVQLDEYLSLISSDLPYTDQSDSLNNFYIFEIGDIGIYECGSFAINVEMGCDFANQGISHCTEASIYQNTDCNPVSNIWDGASVISEGICIDDSVKFTITNIGEENMSESRSYFVIEDQIMIQQGKYDLEIGEDTIFSLAANGFNYYFEAQQSEGHPLTNNTSAIVEDCGIVTFGNQSTIVFPVNDESHFIDIDCTDNISSCDPNDKAGSPIGYGTSNYISPGTDIEYKIRFQNTGTDTAFNVILRDTLSSLLNIESIRAGVSSHSYDFTIEGENILLFNFPNILLVDSNRNEPLSHGFIEFKISHKKDIVAGSEILNQAGIYFDANPVVMTNQTLHTIQINYLEVFLDDNEQTVGNNELGEVNNQIKVFPNPTLDKATFLFENHVTNGNIRIISTTGQLMQATKFTGREFILDGHDYSPGLYIFEVFDGDKKLNVGKILVK